MNALAAPPARERLAARIRRDGPISLADFMAAANEAYYAQGDVFGAKGDFITAPEISQCFGELIGLWVAVLWHSMGRPQGLRLVECGPGRGTLMADAVRAAAHVPGFSEAVRIHLIERSERLRRLQRESLPGRSVEWHDTIDELPAGPAIVIANEFLDALPIRQFERGKDGWSERHITIGANGAFSFTALPSNDPPPPQIAASPPGSILETSPAIEDFTRALAIRLARDGGAALLIDYGYIRTAIGETLQAVSRHRPVPVLSSPGESDLTAHVNFAAVAATARANGVTVHGPVTQGDWLRRLGIEQRAAKLAEGKTAAVRASIDAGVDRLVNVGAMGELFKVLALTHKSLPVPDGFEPLP